jgi:hypothetical protein
VNEVGELLALLVTVTVAGWPPVDMGAKVTPIEHVPLGAKEVFVQFIEVIAKLPFTTPEIVTDEVFR